MPFVFGTVMSNVSVRVDPAGTVKVPYQVRVLPDAVGSEIADALKALEELT